MPATFRVGLLGHGTVGAAFAELRDMYEIEEEFEKMIEAHLSVGSAAGTADEMGS